MSPEIQPRGGKIAASSNIYTAILAVVCGIVAATAAFMAYMCYTQYGTIFNIP